MAKVTIKGQYGGTSFVDSPVVITVDNLSWPNKDATSPFTIVHVEVVYNDNGQDKVVGSFRADTGGQTTIDFDISSALRAIWADYDISSEVGATTTRRFRSFNFKVATEYLAKDGYYTRTESESINGGNCAIGCFTEWERYTATYSDTSIVEFTNNRNGDASTKPTSTPERVGIDSPTSWVDLSSGGTTSNYYSGANKQAGPDGEDDEQGAHPPIVIRDSQEYVDFLFLNHRGAIETCSGMMKEAMSTNIDMKQYSRSERPNFNPTRSLMAIGSDGRRSWQMSSGYVTREWAQWWAMEFLGGKRKLWWMRLKYGNKQEKWVPVTIKPAKSETTIYDKTKQQMAHVDFTVTMALEG